MRGIIIGAGEVGSELAAKLSREGHDITVIDKNPQALEKLASLDVMTIQGNGASLELLDAAGLTNTDLVVAVTQVDEINIIACLLAKNNGAKKTIARVRQTEFGSEYKSITNDRLGIDVIINPELVAATEIMKVLKSAQASEIEFFCRGKVQMLGFRLGEESPVLNIPLKDLDLGDNILIAAINRDNQLIIPGGKDVLKALDHIYLISKTGEHYSYKWLTGKETKRFQKVMIMGAGKVGRHVARMLSKYRRLGIEVKLIDRNLERCREVAEQLPEVLVLHGSGTDLEFLRHEEIENTDVFIAVSGSDEANILSALLAKKLGVEKTVVEINRPDYAPLVETLDIDAAIRPRLLTAGRILKLMRKGKVISLTILGEDQAEIIELNVEPQAPAVGKSLQELRMLHTGILVSSIVRNDKAIIPRGSDIIQAGDRVVVFCLPELNYQASEFFSNR